MSKGTLKNAMVIGVDLRQVGARGGKQYLVNTAWATNTAFPFWSTYTTLTIAQQQNNLQSLFLTHLQPSQQEDGAAAQGPDAVTADIWCPLLQFACVSSTAGCYCQPVWYGRWRCVALGCVHVL